MEIEATTTDISLEDLQEALQRLPTRHRKQVLLFIEFLEYLSSTDTYDDESEDADLWQAVMAHHAYRQAHPDEPPELFDTPEAFLQATAEHS